MWREFDVCHFIMHKFRIENSLDIYSKICAPLYVCPCLTIPWIDHYLILQLFWCWTTKLCVKYCKRSILAHIWTQSTQHNNNGRCPAALCYILRQHFLSCNDSWFLLFGVYLEIQLIINNFGFPFLIVVVWSETMSISGKKKSFSPENFCWLGPNTTFFSCSWYQKKKVVNQS